MASGGRIRGSAGTSEDRGWWSLAPEHEPLGRPIECPDPPPTPLDSLLPPLTSSERPAVGGGMRSDGNGVIATLIAGELHG
ncbi:hypothetical protein E2562_037214 [Oryza meyeriana var. granulata]|uniref:Uncharacterized protein n=1 Tax=Oryza meyeriana var. granulata TaxID=110450 RepID=A0A6G1E7V9_9ORYZ|nr:hypothetical protein E2562_037214 [Oryza meyeriana var. granulata]